MRVNTLALFEIALVLVRFDHVANIIVNANQSVMRATIMHRVADRVASRVRSTITKLTKRQRIGD